MRCNAVAALLTVAALAACDEDADRGGDAPDAASAAADSPAAGPAGPPGPADAPQLAGVCDTINNTGRCARAIEQVQLARTDRAERRGDTLLLALEGGDTARLADRPDAGDQVIRYSYQEHWVEQGYSLIHAQYWEGSSVVLVDDRTGNRTVLPETPLRSPGGDRFAVLSFDLEAGYSPNTVQVWSLAGDRPRMEWEHEPERWGPTAGQWRDNETLTFTRSCVFEEGAHCNTRATVRRTADGWMLEPSDNG